MANNIFSKFYKDKETQKPLLSDSDFLNLPNGKVVQKLTGEEYIKTSINVFDKVERTIPSLSEADNRFAKLHDDNVFTKNNIFNSTVTCKEKTNLNELTVTGDSSLAKTSITDAKISTATVSTKATISTADVTTLNGVTIRPKNAGVGNIGLSNAQWANAYIANVYGIAQHAKYSDLAEKYTTLQNYAEGTVLQVYDGETAQMSVFQGGVLAGVVSTKPGVKINADLPNGQYVCLKGMVPVLTVGKIKKGQYCVAVKGGRVKGIDKSNLTFEDSLNIVGVALSDTDGNTTLVKV